MNGTPWKEIKTELEHYLDNKLIIMCGAGGDFSLLDLKARDYEYFDLQSHWFTTKINHDGICVTEPCSLKSIFLNYYPGESFQSGTHDATADAIATMRIFKEVYLNLTDIDVTTKFNCRPFNNIEKVVPDWKK